MRTSITRWCFAMVLVVVASLAARQGRAQTPAPDAGFDLELDFASSLDALAAASPGLRNLSGPAHIHVGFRARTAAGKALRDRVITIHSPDARLERLPLGEASLEIVTPGDGGRSSLRLDIRGPVATALHLEATLDLDVDLMGARVAWKGGAIDGVLRLEGVDLQRVTLAYPVLALEGKLDLRATVSGTSDDPRLDAFFTARDVTYRTEAVGALQGSLAHAASVSGIDVTWGAPEAPIVALRGKVPIALDLLGGSLRWLDAEPMDLVLSAPSITPARLRPLWYAPPGLDFDVALSIAAKGSLEALAGRATLGGSVQSGASAKLPLAGEVIIGPAEQSLKLRLGDNVLDLDLQAQAPLVAMRRSGQRAEPSPLTGTLRSTLPFSLLVPFLPRDLVDPAGALESMLAFTGTLGTPAFSGSITTQGAAITLLPLQQRLQGVTLATRATGDTLEVTSLSAALGKGTIAGRGRVSFAATPGGVAPAGGLWSAWKLAAGLDLEARGVPLLQDGMPIGTLGAAAKIAWVSGPGDASLDLTVAGGRVDVFEPTMLQPAAIAKNPAVHEFDALGNVRPGEGLFAGTGHLRVGLRLASPFEMKGAGSALSLTGALSLDRKDTIVKVDGGFALTPGSQFDLFDNTFQVLSGKVTLLGGEVGARKGLDVRGGAALAALADPDKPIRAAPFDVVVDVLAEGEAVDTRVAVEIRGPWSRPELLLGSDPELPEYQILTLLITGRIDTVDEADGEVRRKVAALVQRFHQPALGRQLLDKLGVDKIGVGFGASVSEPILTVGKQVNKKLYVETVYHHNAPPDTNAREGRAQLKVGPSMTIDTAFGDAAAGSAGVHWHATFGGQKRSRLGDTVSLFGKTRLPTDSDGDGIADERDGCPLEAEDLDGFQDTDGCADADNDHDGVLDERDDAPDVAETKNGYRDDDGAPDAVPPRLAWEGGQIRTLELERSSARLTAASQRTLEVAAGVLGEYGDLRVEVTGHSDDRGPPALIQSLSETRARAVQGFLLRQGLAAARVVAAGRGADQPRDPAGTEEARARNRRVEMRLVR